MIPYLVVKWLHILSSVALVGTGFGSAFYLFFTHRTGNREAIGVVSRLVVRADTWFTLPAMIFQPVSGVWLMQRAGWTLKTGWIAGAIALYLLAGVCWLPVVWLQLRMRDLASKAIADASALPRRYWHYARVWEWLGYPAFLAMAAVFYLMVVKPS
ncbi:MAG: DUF2269 family protein [Thiobacillaceae bacterium]